MSERPAEPNSLLKLLIDLGPLLVFFLTYAKAGIFWATGVLMVATVAALIASRVLLGRFALAPAVTAVLVVVFGGLTFLLDDPRFIKMKPTIINLLFAGILGFGIATGRPLLKMLMGEALRLTDQGWHKMTVRWALFFVAMAVVNEIVWRNFSEAAWVNFKVFGILPLTLIFAMAQVGLIKRYEARADA
ncbi:MAG: septation protein A [Hyphomonadaceae bacterium]|nr:septation protein A [Hyphomonadaceae bacterium]